jgi:hypothetical protein
MQPKYATVTTKTKVDVNQHPHKSGLSTRITTLLAWSSWILVMVASTISFILRTQNSLALNELVHGVQYFQEVLYWNILIPLAVPAYATVGAIVASRRPHNSVGWLCLGLALLVGVQDVAWQYAQRALEIAPGSLPAGPLLAMLASVLGVFEAPLSYILILLVFPTGQFLSSRWRLLAWITVIVCIIGMLTTLFDPHIHAGEHTALANPIGIRGIQVIAAPLGLIGSWYLNLVQLAVAISIIVRFQRAGKAERQQLKWLVYIGTVSIVVGAIGFTCSYLPLSPYVSAIIGAFSIAGLSIGIPISIGIAMLRYRLYDIDVLINLTLVYGTLTALLALVYFGLIILLQFLLRGFIHQDNGVAIVGSTLAIAALFQPLRRRIQEVIDRRFYRRKYDAARTVETFSATLRNEVELDKLREHLLSVVQETMQPAHVSLWLRPAAPARKREEVNSVRSKQAHLN